MTKSGNDAYPFPLNANTQHSTQTQKHKTFYIMKKETWKFIIQTVLAILTAIATSLGVTSCMS